MSAGVSYVIDLYVSGILQGLHLKDGLPKDVLQRDWTEHTKIYIDITLGLTQLRGGSDPCDQNQNIHIFTL